MNAKISATGQEYSGIIDNARKEALEILGQYRHAAEAEAEVIWQQALEKAGNDVEQIRSEGEKKYWRTASGNKDISMPLLKESYVRSVMLNHHDTEDGKCPGCRTEK